MVISAVLGTTPKDKPQCEKRPVLCAINKVFGDRADEARSVAWCESRIQRFAENGQYLGFFQLGEYERGKTKWGWRAWEQVRAAKRWFVMTGNDWGAWPNCAPS